MAKFHVDSIQEWQPFEHNGVKYDLGHLSSHMVIFKADKKGSPQKTDFKVR
ncbi:hypothetical protein ALQ73_200190 [Pseudomonas savastanoi pv. glycinea]|uniref:Uncharacterized protein n=1 Tax=Pseudomonas savastanoi pv. glycinea TaxID=318 RepID=A0A3M3FP31_PSESG|nr:hypothetical protein ALQ73_200190 [Pseudomonas savastanoi pv. glycinea]